MNTVYSILIIYALTFAIGMMVAGIIWLILNALNYKWIETFKSREHYSEMRRLRFRKDKSIQSPNK